MSEREGGAAIGKFWAGLEMAAGGMIATLCGGCALVSFSLLGGGVGGVLLPALLGGLPALAGVFLFRDGLRRWRRADAAPPARDAEQVDP